MRNAIYEKHKIENVLNVTKLVSIIYYEFNKNFVYEGESHNFWELVYVDAGDVVVGANKKEFVLRQGEMYFHSPGEFHKIRANGVSPANVFILTFVCTSPAMKLFCGSKERISPDIRVFLNKIIKEAKSTFFFTGSGLRLKENAPFGSQQLVRVYLEAFLVLLLQKREQKERIPDTFEIKDDTENLIVSKIISYMEKNICKGISVSDIAGHINYSKTYISVLFKRITGYTMIEYFNIIRISEAKRLLFETDASVGEIAYMLGFNDSHYFARLFKNETGLSPTEYSSSINHNALTRGISFLKGDRGDA